MRSALTCGCPKSYFLGADLTYTFMALNGLMPWGDQKYKLEDQIRADYPHIQEEFLEGRIPRGYPGEVSQLCWTSVGKTADRTLFQPAGR